MKEKMHSAIHRPLVNGKLFYFVPFVLIAFSLSSCHKDKDTAGDPSASFTVSDETVEIGDTVYFTNSSSNASYYQWSFGDGNAAVTEDASHAYDESGTYTVTLVAIGNDKSSTVTQTIAVTGEVTIHDGVGIDELTLGQTWSEAYTKFDDVDTFMYSGVYSDPYYYHQVYYYNKGIGLFYINSNSDSINDDDIFV